ncbi:MAG: alpha-L-rhamnosidase N-terminal domain-containing protein [Kiritimatiellaeota bacterium]|nr:alpha-L-rhamnosidase N-terminal domain-containing protein [Kiritimatiellota bacterium]
MKMKSCPRFALVSVFFALLGCVGAGRAGTVAQLRCENRQDPLGVDVARPRLSWILDAGTQTAYQVVVESAGQQLWDSGRVASGESINIEYAGAPLSSSQQVFWKVRVWPGGEWRPPATWTMGLLGADAWQAHWIGATDVAPPARKAAGYHAKEAARADDVKWVQVDLGRAQPLAAIRLHPMDHAGKAGFGFPVRFKVELSNDPQMKDAVLVADRTASDFPNPGRAPVTFDAQGGAARYVRVTATKLGRFTTKYCFALDQLEALAGGKNAAQGAPVTALDSFEQWGWGKAALTDGGLGQDAEAAKRYSSVLLRRAFTVKPGLRRAVAHVCGLGEYELTLNGAKAGNDLFPSGWTKYDKTCLYDTHDITAALQPGANEVALLLGNGMYNVSGHPRPSRRCGSNMPMARPKSSARTHSGRRARGRSPSRACMAVKISTRAGSRSGSRRKAWPVPAARCGGFPAPRRRSGPSMCYSRSGSRATCSISARTRR